MVPLLGAECVSHVGAHGVRLAALPASKGARLRHTSSGGSITVSVERVGSRARLIVADTGVGIEPRHLPRIFDRYARVLTPGAG